MGGHVAQFWPVPDPWGAGCWEVLGNVFLPMKETNTKDSLLAQSCLGYWREAPWLSAYDRKRTAERTMDANLQPDTFLRIQMTLRDERGWARWIDIWGSECIKYLRRNAQRCPRKVGQESDCEDFVCNSVICQHYLIQGWGWCPCLLAASPPKDDADIFSL